MGRRKAGTYPFDYTDGDDRRFADSGVGGTLRVLHVPGRGMGVTDGVACRVEVLADGAVLDESTAGKFGKEHRLHGTAPGDRVTVAGTARFDTDDACGCGSLDCAPVPDELTRACDVVLTGELGDVVRLGVGPAWPDALAIDTGGLHPGTAVPTACRWGAGVRLRGARPTVNSPDG